MSESELVPLYYLSGIALAVGGGVAGVRSYLGRQREKWLGEGKKEADLAKVMTTNSQVGADNTRAIQGMSSQMRELGDNLREFTAESQRRFDAADRRFQGIEDQLRGGRGPARGPDPV